MFIALKWKERQPVRVKASPQKRERWYVWSQRKRRTTHRGSKGLKNLVKKKLRN